MSRRNAGSRILGFALVVGMVMSALVFMAFLFDDVARNRIQLVPIGMIAEGVIFGMLAFGPIGRSIGRLLEGDGGSPDLDNVLLSRLADIEDRLGEISGEVQRVNEIESRVEFAERLLAKPATDFGKEDR